MNHFEEHNKKEAEYILWLNSLKAGDEIVSVTRRHNYGSYGVRIVKRVVEKRTPTQIVFNDGKRVRSCDGFFVGDHYTRLDKPAAVEEIEKARNEIKKLKAINKIKDNINDGLKKLSIEQLNSILNILDLEVL